MEVIEKLQPEQSHGEGLLRNGGLDGTVFDQLERRLVDVHGHQYGVLRLGALEGFSHILA